MDESAAIDLCGLPDDLPTEQPQGSHTLSWVWNLIMPARCGDLVVRPDRVWWVSPQGKLPLSGISVTRLEDSADHKNAFEIAGRVTMEMQGRRCFVMGAVTIFDVTYFDANL